MPTRRAFITAGGLALAGLAASRAALAATLAGSRPVEIGMMSDTLGTSVWFDPIGVLIEPGQTVQVFLDSANATLGEKIELKVAQHLIRCGLGGCELLRLHL